MAVWYVAEGTGLEPVPVPATSAFPLPGTYVLAAARCPLCLAVHPVPPATVRYCPPCAAAVARDPWLARPEVRPC